MRLFTALLAGLGLLGALNSVSAAPVTKHYTALGASDVNGFGATNPATEGYVPLITDWMNARAPEDVTYELKSRGVDGFTALDVVGTDADSGEPGTQTTLSQAIGDVPAVVTLWIGVNDVLHIGAPARFPTSPYNTFGTGVDGPTVAAKLTAFETAYGTIIDQLQTIPNVQLVTGNVPLMGDAYIASLGTIPTPLQLQTQLFLNGLSLEVTNRINAKAAGAGVAVVDLYTLSGTGIFTAADLADDGHFNTSGYAKLALLFERQLQVFSLFDLLVTTADDTDDPNDDLLSLREAINLANSRDGEDTIRFDDAIAGDTIYLNSSLPSLTTDINLVGSVTDGIFIDGNASISTAVLTVGSPTGPDANIAISDVILSGGSAELGGGIINYDNLTLTNSVVFLNEAWDSFGGGIANFGSATISQCMIGQNYAEHGGAGIYNAGQLEVVESGILGNESFGADTISSRGGGVYNAGGTATFTSCFIQGNSSDAFDSNTPGHGGGIYNTGDLTTTECIITDNIAGGDGAGIYTEGMVGAHILRTTIAFNGSCGCTGDLGFGGGFFIGDGPVSVSNSTIAFNDGLVGAGLYLDGGSVNITSSTITENWSEVAGGGVRNDTTVASKLVLKDSIVSWNYGFLDEDVSGQFTDGGFNLLYVDPGFELDPDNQAYLDVFGGFVPTIPLAPGSIAVNGGDPAIASGTATDQRGTGFERVRAGRLDIGAFEVQIEAPVAKDIIAVIKPGAPKIGVTLEASDADGDPLTYSIVTGPAHGSNTVISDTLLVYQPNGTFTGLDTFTYKVNDGYVDSNLATVTIKYNSAPSVVSVIPGKLDGSVVGSGNSSHAGEELRLRLQVSDPDGANHLRMVYLTFNRLNANSGGIVLSYDPLANKMYLRSDDGLTVLGGEAPGAAVAPVSNSFGSLDFSQSEVTTSGSTMTVDFVVTPTAAFDGLKSLWAKARDRSGAETASASVATWTVIPTPLSSATVQDFMQRINRTAPSFLVKLPYQNPKNLPLTFSIVSGPTAGSLSAVTGNTVTFTPGASFPGTAIFTFKANDGVADTNIATATIQYSATPQLVSLTPMKADGSVVGSGQSSSTGEKLKIVVNVSDADGVTDIRNVLVTFNNTLSNSGGIALTYNALTDTMSMRNFDGSVVLPGGKPGNAVPAIDNGYAELDIATSESSKAGGTLTLTFVVTPHHSFHGPKKIWLQATDAVGEAGGFTEMATWTVNQVSPSAPQIAPLVFTTSGIADLTSEPGTFEEVVTTFTDLNGGTDLALVQMQIGASNTAIPASAIACQYDVKSGKVYLLGDDGKTKLGGVRPGTGTTVSNSQGTLDTKNSQVTISGNQLVIRWKIAPKAGFLGTKAVKLFARDGANLTAGWSSSGNWTIHSSAGLRFRPPSVKEF